MALVAAAVTAMAQIGNDPNAVYIRVSARDPQGRYISGLKPEDFKIEEDKAPQQVLSLSEDIPVSVALMIDARGSLKDTLNSAARVFMPGSNNPADQLFLIERTDAPLNEAVLQGLRDLIQRGTNPIRAFVLLTDRDNPASASFSKVKEVLKEQDVEFFVVGVPGDVEVLRDLARLSGGETFFPASVIHFEGICRTLARDLRNQYLIGYRPTNLAQDGKWRKVTITGRLTDPRTNKTMTPIFRAKPGYYAPLVAGK
jgi:Ca-activated chloride channel family protein